MQADHFPNRIATRSGGPYNRSQVNRENDMSGASPYEPPRGAITPAPPTDYGEIKLLSVRSRLDRMRYIGCSVGLGVLVNRAGGLPGGVATVLEGGGDPAGYLVGGMERAREAGQR